MIFEIALIEVKAGLEKEFESGVAEAAPLFRRARGCRSLSLHRSIENPRRYRLVVGWDTVDDHMVAFRSSPDFQEWRTLVGHCFERPPEVEHTSEVLRAF